MSSVASSRSGVNLRADAAERIASDDGCYETLVGAVERMLAQGSD